MTTPKEILSSELDKALIESDSRWEAIRDAERNVAALKTAVQAYDVEAQRLRQALFALDGDTHKSFGDANAANHKRTTELRRGQA